MTLTAKEPISQSKIQFTETYIREVLEIRSELIAHVLLWVQKWDNAVKWHRQVEVKIHFV